MEIATGSCGVQTTVDQEEQETSSESSLLRRTSIIIPTFNAGRYWGRLQDALEQQGVVPEQVLVVDSSSTDNTRRLARQAGYHVHLISKESFRHGATRQLAAELLPHAEILVYLTQDALPCGSRSFQHILKAFGNPLVGACYGRQMPRPEADPIERHARLFNYPASSELRSFESRKEVGIRAAFFSNSFAAYRRTAFEEVGGFPRDTIVSEEVTVAARMLMAGWKIAYQAEAKVIHSHPLTLRTEFSRYFDIGVHHGRASWLLDTFGTARGEGRRFVESEVKFLLQHRPYLLGWAALRNISKWCSYQLGRHERFLPQLIKEKISAQPVFWKDARMTEVVQVLARADVRQHL